MLELKMSRLSQKGAIELMQYASPKIYWTYALCNNQSINQSACLNSSNRLCLAKSKLLHYFVIRDLTRVNQKSLLPYVSPKALIFNMYLSHTIGSISNPIRNKMYNLVTLYDRFWISEVHYVFSTWLGFSNFFPQNLHT